MSRCVLQYMMIQPALTDSTDLLKLIKVPQVAGAAEAQTLS